MIKINTLRYYVLAMLSLVAICNCQKSSDSDPQPVASEPIPGRISVYVPMSDGVQLALDAWLPESVTTKKVPTLVRITRYWRGFDYLSTEAAANDVEDGLANVYLSMGYAFVAVDVRGSGASYGVNTGVWNPQEQADGYEVLDWIVKQPWSNGWIGAIGVSYDANAAILVNGTGHPALKAVVARFPDFDPYAHIAFPGGIQNVGFNQAWATYTAALDQMDLCGLAAMMNLDCNAFKQSVKGPRLVETSDASKLAVDHAQNGDLLSGLASITYRDDPVGTGSSLDAVAPYAKADAINQTNIPWLLSASWMDSATALGALQAYETFQNPMTVVIGAFSHAGLFHSDPLDPSVSATAPQDAQPTVTAQYMEAIGFLGKALKQEETTREIRYVTLGEGVWRTTTVWPPVTVANKIYTLDGTSSLTDTPLSTPSDTTLEVDINTSTGPNNRWVTPLDGRTTHYEDRTAEDNKLLTFTTEPLTQDIRVTGTPVLQIRFKASTSDAAIFAYLEDVTDGGKVSYVTEGQLRLLHQGSGSGLALEPISSRSYRNADAKPYTQNEVIDVTIPLKPVSALFKSGHRVRIAIGGADVGTFAAITQANTVFTIQAGNQAGSTLTLPIDSD